MPQSDPVLIVDHDPAWPERFRALADRVHAVLGPLALRVEHVGSTAVPGLPAKPVIDLDVVVASPSDLPAAIEALGRIGYAHRGDLGIPRREAFRHPPGEARHHLYVCSADSPALRDHLAFRDHLRAHPEVAQEYGELKRALAARHAHDRKAYGLAKSAFVDAVTAAALDGR